MLLQVVTGSSKQEFSTQEQDRCFLGNIIVRDKGHCSGATIEQLLISEGQYVMKSLENKVTYT